MSGDNSAWRKSLSMLLLLPFSISQANVPLEDNRLSNQFTQEIPASRQVVSSHSIGTDQIEDLQPLVQENELEREEASSLLLKLKGLQQELDELRTEMNKQAGDIATLHQQQLAVYKDLENRAEKVYSLNRHAPKHEELSENPKEEALNTLSSGETPSVDNTSIRSLPKQIFSTNEQIAYLAAYDLVKSKRFEEALSAMSIFTTRYPQGGYSANAQYWLGELYMVKNNYPKAIEHFEIVLKKFPLSSKRPASTLKIAYALAGSGRIEEAKKRLHEVLLNYPDTPTAHLAEIKLESLGVS